MQPVTRMPVGATKKQTRQPGPLVVDTRGPNVIDILPPLGAQARVTTWRQLAALPTAERAGIIRTLNEAYRVERGTTVLET